jgi:hypothetical protein
MGATSGAHTAVEVATTSLNWTMMDHRPAESALSGIVIEAESEIVAETAVAATLSRVAIPEEDGQRVRVLQPGLVADSDQPGRSATNLVVVSAWESVDWPWAGYIGHLRWFGCQQAPF